MQAVVRPTRPGAPPRVRLIPPTSYARIRNRARTVGRKRRETLRVERARAANVIDVRGTVPADGKERRRAFSVENPTAFAATVLRETLLAAGVSVRGEAFDRDDLERPPRRTLARTLAEHRSATLAEILVTLNKVSQNLYAEELIRAASRRASGRSDMESAARHAGNVLRRLGVDTAGLVIADGSGLTRLNLVKPSQIAALLIGMWNGEHRDLFVSTLPIAGVDGTLRSRFRRSAARKHVRAKTGFISRVVALSGYVSRPRSAPPIVFSVLVNNFTCPTSAAKAAVDRFVTALARHAGWQRPKK